MWQDDDRGVSEWKDELNEYGVHFAASSNREAAIFIYTLYQMACHKLPTESLKLEVRWSGDTRLHSGRALTSVE